MLPAGTATEVIAGGQYGAPFKTGVIELEVLIQAAVGLVTPIKKALGP
jgi:hypothetical protein